MITSRTPAHVPSTTQNDLNSVLLEGHISSTVTFLDHDGAPESRFLFRTTRAVSGLAPSSFNVKVSSHIVDRSLLIHSHTNRLRIVGRLCFDSLDHVFLFAEHIELLRSSPAPFPAMTPRSSSAKKGS